MSLEPTSKRARVAEKAIGDDTSLVGAVAAYKASQIQIYYGLKEYTAASVKERGSIYRVLTSTYIDDVENLGTFVVPRYLRSFDVMRDSGTGRITCIHDDTTKLVGPKLARALALESLRTQGFDVLIFPDKGDAVSCLALPSTWQIEEDTTTTKKEHHEKIFKLFHTRGFARVFVSSSHLNQLLSLPYMPLSKTRIVATRLNQLVERGELTLEIGKLSKLKRILDAQDDGNAKTVNDFLEELLAACVASSDDAHRVNAFRKRPSPSLARRLNLRKPYQGKLIDRSTNREATMVKLGDLDDGADVLMSTVSVDTKFYHSVTSDVASWMVYQANPNLGTTVQKKGWVKLEGQSTMKAEHLVTVMEAIAGSNQSIKAVPTDKDAADAETLDKLSGNVDI